VLPSNDPQLIDAAVAALPDIMCPQGSGGDIFCGGALSTG
jgi:hypothetical protein